MIYVTSNDGMLHGFDSSNGTEMFGFVPDNLMLGAFSQPIKSLLKRAYIHRFLVKRETPQLRWGG
jgi:type IV pilus assembly protein PilY1